MRQAHRIQADARTSRARKACNVCKEEKALKDFSRNRINKDGYNRHCKECQKIKYARWRFKNWGEAGINRSKKSVTISDKLLAKWATEDAARAATRNERKQYRPPKDDGEPDNLEKAKQIKADVDALRISKGLPVGEVNLD